MATTMGECNGVEKEIERGEENVSSATEKESEIQSGEQLNVLPNDRSPIRRSLLSRYLSIKEEEAHPVLSEYFGVALAFTALGALIRRVNERKALQAPALKRKAQRVALNSLLKRAMERLHTIASKAQELQTKLQVSEPGSSEQAELRLQVAEMKKRRDEDAKANEKVMTMFSTQEQQWKRERKRLKGEILNLRKELSDQSSACLECKKKDLLVFQLKSELKEQEFLVAAVTEASSVEHSDRCELARKLAEAEEKIESLTRELGTETEARQVERTEARDHLEKLELELENERKSSSSARSEALDEKRSRMESEEQCTMLLREQKRLEEELKDQERVIAALVGRVDCLKAENSELVERLNAPNFNLRRSPAPQALEFDSSMREVHAEQQRELHSMYMDQVTELENQIGYYQERVLRLEESALLRLDSDPNRVNVHGDVEEMFANLAGSGDKDHQLRAAKTLLAQYMDAERSRELELGKWRKLYAASKIALSMAQSGNDSKQSMKQHIEAARAQQAQELAERHWYEIDSFERLMKAKDERMEALRLHLVSLENQVKRSTSELREARSSLDAEAASRADAEARLRETEQQLKACSEKLEEASSGAKKRLRSLEESDLNELLESKEAEIHGKNLRLAFVEAKLVQVQMQFENERKMREGLIAEVLREKQALEDLARDSLQTGQDLSLKNAIASACSEVEKLSDKIADAREQINGSSLQSSDAPQLGKVLKERNTSSSRMVVKSSSELAENAFAPILMKEQLQQYHQLLQKINELSFEVESGTSDGTLRVEPTLQRAVNIQSQVNSLGRKLLLLSSSHDSATFQGPRLLSVHLTEIQKRLELKVGNLINELRLRVDKVSQRPRLRRSNTTGSSNDATMQLVLQTQSQPVKLQR